MMDVQTITTEAINRVHENAGQQWIDIAWRAAWRFFHLLPPGATFQSYDLIQFAESQYGAAAIPHDRRAWGAILRTMQKDGQIERAGFEQSKASNRHLAPVSVWAKV